MMRRLITTGVVLCALALAGCNGGDGGGDDYGSEQPRQPVPTTGPATPGSTSTPGAGGTALPLPGTCVSLPEADDGRYAVGDVGTVEVRRDGDRLTLGEVTTAAGWTHTVVDEAAREIEITFRRGEDEVEFEAELEDNGVEVDVCRGD